MSFSFLVWAVSYLYSGPYFKANEGPIWRGFAMNSGKLPLIPFGKKGPGTFKSLKKFFTLFPNIKQAIIMPKAMLNKNIIKC